MIISETVKPERPIPIYLIAVWMVVNIILLLSMIPHDPNDLNNYLEPILWLPSLIGLLLMRKWGAALSIAVLCITLGTSMWNVLLAYYTNTLNLAFAPINALRIAVNAIVTIYLFTLIFAGKFK